MDKKTKEDLGEFFAESFREVVLPEIEDIRENIEDIRENMMTKEDGLKLERKIDAAYTRADRHGKTLENHEKRIKKVETKVSIASV